MKYELSLEAEEVLNCISEVIPKEKLLNEAIELLDIIFEARSTGKQVHIVNSDGIAESQIVLNINPVVIELAKWKK